MVKNIPMHKSMHLSDPAELASGASDSIAIFAGSR